MTVSISSEQKLPPAPHRIAAEAGPVAADKLVAGDCRGRNFYEVDTSFRSLLAMRLPSQVLSFIGPHLEKLGALAGGRLDELAATADKERHKPVLKTRNRFGVDEDWIEFHPAYREMEKIAFSDFGIHAMSRTPGVLGSPSRYLPLAKYAFQYVFVQAEFGLMCPISLTDSSTYLIETYGDAALRKRFLPGMTSTDPSLLLKGAQFMTERAGGSDVGSNRLQAVPEGDVWKLYGDKWFCSAVDADVVLLLARPDGAEAGTRGLALFAMPRVLDDGRRNSYRIARLKDKMGTRSMASGEVIFEGATAYLVGEIGMGLRQMLDQVNLSRLSHGVRAAAMMRRCLNEATVVSQERVAFGRKLADMPLHRRQMMKLMLPTEQALSMFTYAAQCMQLGDDGDARAGLQLRILTPLLKFRSSRDNIKVATGAMEIRGGNGYIEDFVNERLVRDAHIGVLWEGTSNINAIDAVQRAAGKEGAHNAVIEALNEWLTGLREVPSSIAKAALDELRRAGAFIDSCVQSPEGEPDSREASSRMYHATTAVLMLGEGALLGRDGGDSRRMLLGQQVLRYRLNRVDVASAAQAHIEALLLNGKSVPLETSQRLLEQIDNTKETL